MLSSSKKIHASVFSVAGWPSSGSCCTKSVIGSVVLVDRLVEPAVDAERRRARRATVGRVGPLANRLSVERQRPRHGGRGRRSCAGESASETAMPTSTAPTAQRRQVDIGGAW